MAGIFPFIINNFLNGMLNGQESYINGSNNNQGNNINDILNQMISSGNYINIQNNNNIFEILNEALMNKDNSMKRAIDTLSNEKFNTDKEHQKSNRKQRKPRNGDNNINNNFTNTFNEIFNQTFTAVINNQDFIGNIVDTVLNSDLVNGLISEIESLESVNIELKDYDDKYLIEGRLPGISKKDIDLDYNEDIITVKVKSNQLFTNGKNSMITIVQPNADIEKKFIVNNVDTNRIKAVFKSEKLSIYLPKIKREVDNPTIIDVDNYIS